MKTKKTKPAEKEKDDHGLSQAKAQLESIKEMVAALSVTADAKGYAAREDAERAIQEDPLSIEIRGDWHTPGGKEEKGEGEYRILLCTGGPACRVIGELSRSEPTSARIEYQDWFLPWTEHRIDSKEEEILLTYARCFYYGE